jgi:Fe-only nitrogenase accessory protein AnfO
VCATARREEWQLPRDIAIFVGKNGSTAALNEEGKLIVYRKKKGKWNVIREREFTLADCSGMRELRKKMGEALFFLNDCKIIIGSSVVGVPYFELEKSDFSIWEFQGKPADILDHVLEKEEYLEMEKVSREEYKLPTVPEEVSPGCYRLSLKDIQEGNTGITSKQALQPFLRKGSFYELIIICSHVPPWLEAEILGNNLDAEFTGSGPGEIMITITKKCCSQCN